MSQERSEVRGRGAAAEAGALEVAFVALGFPPEVGGAETYNLEYARRLHERGQRLRVFTWSRGNAREAEVDAALPFEVYRESLRMRGGAIEPQGIDRVLGRWRPQVAFVSRGSRLLVRVVSATARCAPLVVSMHDLGGRRRGPVGRLRVRRRYGLDRAVRVVANSEDTRSRLLDLRVPEEKLALVHPGVDVDRFAPHPDGGERARKDLGLEGRLVLLTVSRLAANKRHALVIDLLPRLREKLPELVYLVVGEGREREELERRARLRGVGDLVRFEGFVEDVRSYYNACHVFVMASGRASEREKAAEGFGIAYVEAGACGKPVVGSVSGGGAEVILDGCTGRLVDPRDAAALEAALLELLTDRDKRRAFGEEARRHVRRYDWERGATALECALREAASSGR